MNILQTFEQDGGNREARAALFWKLLLLEGSGIAEGPSPPSSVFI